MGKMAFIMQFAWALNVPYDQAMPLAHMMDVVVADLIGSLCTGYLLVKWKTGRDVRDQGSGGVGATNVGRQLGRTGFIATLLGDALKGSFAVFLLPHCREWVFVAVVAGHIWPVFLRFRGGRGVATAIGALLVLNPLLLLPVALGTGIMLPILKRFTLAGLVGFLLLPLGAWLLDASFSLLAACAVVSGMILYAHRGHLEHAIRKKPVH